MTVTDSKLRFTDLTGPNWDLVPFDVPCARCGHDLRGQTAPVCPACKLEFDWSVAVPIDHLTCEKCDYHLMGLSETRCPECGTWFTWTEALDAYRRRQKPLFEYRWRERPVRSLIRTWFMALRPKRFWSKLDIHDPPQVRPLVVMAAITLFIFAVTLAVCMSVEAWLWSARSWSWGGGTRGLLLMDLPSAILTAMRERVLYTVLVSTTVWLILSPVALLVFQQSMRLCKIRASHLIRVGAYGVPLMLPGAAVIGYLPTLLEAQGIVSTYYGIDLFLALIVLTHVTWSIRCAYVHYLRMPHATAVAITSQAMAILGTLAICALIYEYSFVGTLLLRLGRLLGVW
ncbi:MAG: hypothetical protein IH987_21120 [Planctomycetes bacterium]|nr:hypothetical protein [Planctomycetota bacterium]